MMKFRRRCVDCGNVMDAYAGKTWCAMSHKDITALGNVVLWQEDPFLVEIHEDDTPRWLCLMCAEESALDI